VGSVRPQKQQKHDAKWFDGCSDLLKSIGVNRMTEKLFSKKEISACEKHYEILETKENHYKIGVKIVELIAGFNKMKKDLKNK